MDPLLELIKKPVLHYGSCHNVSCLRILLPLIIIIIVQSEKKKNKTAECVMQYDLFIHTFWFGNRKIFEMWYAENLAHSLIFRRGRHRRRRPVAGDSLSFHKFLSQHPIKRNYYWNTASRKRKSTVSSDGSTNHTFNQNWTRPNAWPISLHCEFCNIFFLFSFEFINRLKREQHFARIIFGLIAIQTTHKQDSQLEDEKKK